MRSTPFRLAPLAMLVAGCTFNTTVNRLDDAPNVPRSNHALVVSAPPHAGVLLGTVTVRGNAHMVGPACAAEAVAQAKRIGATHVIVRPVETTGYRGVRCTGDAYYVGAIVTG